MKKFHSRYGISVDLIVLKTQLDYCLFPNMLKYPHKEKITLSFDISFFLFTYNNFLIFQVKE